MLIAASVLLPGAARAAGDDAKYCDPAAANVVVYLDVTSPYDAVDRNTLIDGVGKILENLKGGERLSLRTIEGSFADSRRLVEACMPRCPSEGFFSDLFSDCTEGVVINKRRQLKSAVADSIKAVFHDTELPHSEIIRTLSRSAEEEYRKDRQNAFYVFSDLIENSEFLPGAKFLGTRNTALMALLRQDFLIPDLHGADVEVFGFGRTGSKQALDQEKLKKIEEFWNLYFLEAGANLTIAQNLQATP